MVSYTISFTREFQPAGSLNPYCSGQWSRTHEEGTGGAPTLAGLNPYCSGQWSRTYVSQMLTQISTGLNPYCSGQWSRTYIPLANDATVGVLILIVVDNGLVHA